MVLKSRTVTVMSLKHWALSSTVSLKLSLALLISGILISKSSSQTQGCDPFCISGCEELGSGQCDGDCWERYAPIFIKDKRVCRGCDPNCVSECTVRGPYQCDGDCGYYYAPAMVNGSRFCLGCDLYCSSGCKEKGPGQCDGDCYGNRIPSVVDGKRICAGPVGSQERTASCNILAESGLGSVSGIIQLSQPLGGGNVTLKINLSSLTPSGLHGFHVHANSSLGDSCAWAAGHLNVDHTLHGAPTNPQNKRHTGDLGNILADANGNADVTISDWLISLDPSSPYNILGKPIVVHAMPDDLGRGNSTLSNTTGNAGARLGCCIIAGPSAALPTTTPASLVITGLPTTTSKITTTFKSGDIAEPTLSSVLGISSTIKAATTGAPSTTETPSFVTQFRDMLRSRCNVTDANSVPGQISDSLQCVFQYIIGLMFSTK